MGNVLLDPRCPVTRPDLVEVRRITQQGYLHGYDMLRIHGPWSQVANADGKPVDAGKQPRAGWRDPGHPTRSLPWLLNVSPLLCNTGIVAGSVRALDIDISDASLCRRYLHAALGRSGLSDSFVAGLIPHRGRSNSSKCLLAFRSEDPTRGKVSVAGDHGHKVEFLGNGQQFVAHGWHPSDMSGKVQLAWWPRPIWEIPVAELVVMTPEIEQAFIKTALEVLPSARMGVCRHPKSGTMRAGAGNWGNPLDAPATPDELMQIASLLPNTVVDWESWNTNLMRFFAASHGSDAGLAAASAWSNKIFAQHGDLQPKYTVEERWNYWRRSPTSAPSRTGTGALVLAVREAIGDPNWHFAAPRAGPRGVSKEKGLYADAQSVFCQALDRYGIHVALGRVLLDTLDPAWADFPDQVAAAIPNLVYLAALNGADAETLGRFAGAFLNKDKATVLSSEAASRASVRENGIG